MSMSDEIRFLCRKSLKGKLKNLLMSTQNGDVEFEKLIYKNFNYHQMNFSKITLLLAAVLINSVNKTVLG
jgi:hypothetical protein